MTKAAKQNPWFLCSGLTLLLGACSGSPNRPQERVEVSTSGPQETATKDAQPKVEAAEDPIDALVARLSASMVWNNGGFPKIDLPEGAPPPKVVSRVFENISFDPGPVKTHAIKEVREVVIGSDTRPYTAAWVETDQGDKIVLIRYESADVGWWSRAFASETTQ